MAKIKNAYKKNESSTKKNKKKKGISKFKSVISFLKDERLHKSIGLLFILFSFYLLIAFTSYLFTWKVDYNIIDGKSFSFVFSDDSIQITNWLGKLGAYSAHKFLKVWFGISSYIFPFVFFIIGVRILFKVSLLPIVKTLKISAVVLVWLSICMGYFFESPYDFMGGLYGAKIISWIINIAGSVGAAAFVFFTGFLSVIVLFNPSFNWVGNLIDSIKNDNPDFIPEDENIAQNSITEEDIIEEDVQAPIEFPIKDEIATPTLDLDNELAPEPIIEPVVTETSDTDSKELEVEAPKEEDALSETELSDKVKEFGLYDPKLDLSQYQLPGIELLADHGSGNIQVNKEELELNKNRIIETLGHYKIEISKIKATIGPSVTLYEIVPSAGVRISKIKNLEDDIALSLSALGIRIIAPMPGKGTVGIEVPNSNPDIVSMKALIASDKFQNSHMELPVALGKTISNETFVTDLTKMPHLLMAGATGQGKSVGLNAILVSLLYKKHPSQIKFVLVDPKKVELAIYNKIERHFLAKLPDDGDAIITDTSKVVATLNSLCVEMDQRYELLKEALVRNIKEYNQKFINRKLNPEKGHRYLPYIVLVIDEFADLIMTAGKEIETPIARLAQLARAIGIHLIVATQRPSVNVITGIIKANFPARIAFRVTSSIDSKTILDTGGANQLIGRGDMLFSNGNDVIRIQCGFVDTPEVGEIVDYIGTQRGYPEAFLLPEYIEETAETREIDDELDSLFEDAAEIIVNSQQGSASLLQRKLKLGYNRAGRIIDQLEATGLIGGHRGSKAREVLIPDVLALEQFLKDLRDKGKLN
jgi:DNA segregation ATPase FtsK/SpoIIIE, S-DNA-T family